MRDEKEERKKQARSNKQTKQSNTVRPYAYQIRVLFKSVVAWRNTTCNRRGHTNSAISYDRYRAEPIMLN